MRRSLSLLLLATVALCPSIRAQAEEAVPSSALTGDLSRLGERSSAPAAAPVPPRKPPFPVDAHIDAYAKFGSDRRLGGTEAFLPLSWDGQILSFADLRFVADDADSREVNAGLGARRVSEDGSYILGGYGFLDRRRSSTGNLYSQVTAGAEVLGEDWEARGNVYVPLSGEKTLSETTLPAALSLSGTGIVATGGTATAKETPLFGADVEVGYKLPFLLQTWFEETRAYAGAYHFDAPDTASMDGTRFRIETAPFEWLRFGTEVQHDTIRGETGFVEARIRVPLDFWRGTKHGPARAQGIYKRLDTRIARDVDVVTQTGTVRQEKTETILNAATGTAQKIYVVDNTAAAGGDGSADRPFSTLAAAQSAAGAHGIIYVKAGDGTTTGMNAGVTLSATGQKLIGSGVDLTFDADTMRVARIPGLTDGAVISPATTAPVVTNAAGNGVSITADSVEVAGLRVSAASDNGIYAYNADDVILRDITATGNTNDGVRIEASGAGVSVTGVSVEDVSASGNAAHGVHIEAGAGATIGMVEVSGLVAQNNVSAATGHGLVIIATGADSEITEVSVNNGTFFGNGRDGILVQATSDGDIGTMIIDGVTSQNNTGVNGRGIYVQASGVGSTITEIYLKDSMILYNASQGVRVQSINGGTIGSANLEGINSNNNSNGIRLEASGAGSILNNIFVRNSISSDNGASGLYLFAQTGGALGAKVETLSATGNAQNGIYVDDDTVGAYTVDLGGGALGSAGNNRVYENTGTDLRVDLDGGLLMAEDNWWGDVAGLQPARVTLEVGSTVDSTPFLLTDPGP